jgi:putative membrane protein
MENKNYKTHISLFIKGIVIGIGGIAPGLSGSVIMISLGLYTRTIDAFANLFKEFKKNIIFLGPIMSGMMISAAFFSRIIDNLLKNYGTQTRLAFFGMLIGTLPLFYAEVKREEKLKPIHYVLMVPSFLVGIGMLIQGGVNNTEELTIPLLFVLGFLGVALTIIPGLNWATFFSALGIYEHWLLIMSFRFNETGFAIYIPVLVGAIVGLFTVSKAVSYLLHKNYTATLSVLFGFYLAIIPGIAQDSSGGFVTFESGMPFYIGMTLFVIGIFVAYWCGMMSKRGMAEKS